MSVGKFFLYFIFVLALAGCVVKSRSDKASEFSPEGGSVTSSKEEVSLLNDRRSIEELRKNIPEETRDRNDALKSILSLMGEVKVHPSKVRSKFNKLQRDRRTKFQKKYSKERDQFTKNERKDRDNFRKMISKKRDELRDMKLDRDQRKEKYDELDAESKDFYGRQRDARKEFESDMREKQKDFYDELKQQRDEFSEEWRIYNRRWRDWQDEKKKKARLNRNSMNVSPSGSMNTQDASGFQQLNSTQGQALSPDDQ